MISHVMPYINSATALVPNFGKMDALTFTAGLVSETFVRFSIDGAKDCTRSLLKRVQLAKTLQPVPIARNYFDSNPTKLMGMALVAGSQLPFVHNLIVRLTKVNNFGNNKTLHYVQIEADRPSLISFVQVAGEMVNIVSKVLGSLGTGIVVQKMVTGDTSGKIRFVVSTVLLALSAWNVKNTFRVYVQS